MSETVETNEEDFYDLELRIERKFDHDMQCRLAVLAYVIATDEWGGEVPYHVQQELEAWEEEYGDLDQFRDSLLAELRKDEEETGDGEAEQYAVVRSKRLQDEWEEKELLGEDDEDTL